MMEWYRQRKGDFVIMTIRTVWAVLAAVFFFVCSLPVMLIVWIAGKFAPQAADRISYATVCWGLRLVAASTGCPVTIVGQENIPKDCPSLFVGNHRSIFDIIMTAPLLPRPFIIIAKKELGKIPLLHFWMKRIHCLFLDRSDIRAGAQMVTDAAAGLKNGSSVLIFPEGTRTKEEGRIGEFKGGSFKIAIRAGAPVVPITLIGTGNILEDHPMKVYKTPVTIVIGTPIETGNLSIAERKLLPEKVEQVIAMTYQQYAPEKWRGIV